MGEKEPKELFKNFVPGALASKPCDDAPFTACWQGALFLYGGARKQETPQRVVNINPVGEF